MFVSMEMDMLSIQQRLASLHTKVQDVRGQEERDVDRRAEDLKKGLKVLKGYKAPFWVVDGNLTATVDDVYLLAKQLKPKAVFIDGAYLMKHPTERDRYKRVSENADLPSRTKIANEIGPVVAHGSSPRQRAKKKKGEEVTARRHRLRRRDRPGCRLVMGLFEEENVETLKRRRVKILKGRSGETGEFLTQWNFDKMDFSEVAHGQRRQDAVRLIRAIIITFFLHAAAQGLRFNQPQEPRRMLWA